MTNLQNALVPATPRIPLTEMSVAQIAALPHRDLQDAHFNLQALQTAVKAALDRMHAALDQRYAEQAQATRLAAGKDFGVCHLNDGPLSITVDLPKKVAWDQKQLAEIAQRIALAGDKVGDYIDTDYSIPEQRFNSWPPTLKESFAKARTVKAGKPTYRLALLEGDAA